MRKLIFVLLFLKFVRSNNKLVLTLDAFGDNVNYSARIFKNCLDPNQYSLGIIIGKKHNLAEKDNVQ